MLYEMSFVFHSVWLREGLVSEAVRYVMGYVNAN
jgi:hypothetical protein